MINENHTSKPVRTSQRSIENFIRREDGGICGKSLSREDTGVTGAERVSKQSVTVDFKRNIKNMHKLNIIKCLGNKKDLARASNPTWLPSLFPSLWQLNV